jgi:transketolase
MRGFGASAPGERLFQEFNLTPQQVAETVRLLSSNPAAKIPRSR